MSHPPWLNDRMLPGILNRRRFAALFPFFAASPALAGMESAARRIAPCLPVHQSHDPVARVFLGSLRQQEAVPLYYQGGSTPGAFRRFRPVSLYRLFPGGPIYAHGFCLLRQETRTLRLDRVRLA